MKKTNKQANKQMIKQTRQANDQTNKQTKPISAICNVACFFLVRCSGCSHCVGQQTKKQINKRTSKFFFFMASLRSPRQGRLDIWMDGWVDGWMDGWMEMRVDAHIYNIYIKKDIYRRMWIYVYINIYIYIYISNPFGAWMSFKWGGRWMWRGGITLSLSLSPLSLSLSILN